MFLDLPAPLPPEKPASYHPHRLTSFLSRWLDGILATFKEPQYPIKLLYGRIQPVVGDTNPLWLPHRPQGLPPVLDNPV